MQGHTKIYADFFGYKIPEDFECECCQQPAVDIHHIESRGMGGDPQGKKDTIRNLMALCRQHHNEYGDVPELKPMLRLIHLKYMKYKGLRCQIIKLSPPLEQQIKETELEIAS